MEVLVHYALLFLLIMECSALTCRSEHGPKNEELKKVYNNCLRQQQQGKSNDNRRQTSENEWRNRGENEKNKWENSNRSDNREDRMGNRNDRDQNRGYSDNNNRRNDWQSDMNENRRMDGRYGFNNGRDNMKRVEKGTNGGRNDMKNSYSTTERLRVQDEFLQSEEYGDASENNYYSSARPRRYKREKHIEINSGQRSQYNPHSQKNNGNHDKNHETENGGGKSSNENNSSKEIDKACVLHCFIENLHMTDDRGMPDRYLVTHTLTKDETNEDLRDFLQESIEECFQILDNENTDDQCEYSMNLLTCLSEKGRANCDDWNGKPSFLF